MNFNYNFINFVTSSFLNLILTSVPMNKLIVLFLFFSLYSMADCPPSDGLYTDNYSFNSTSAFVDGHWDSMLGTGVDHFLIKYKEISATEWSNLANLDSVATSRTIGPLEFNTTYVWSIVSYCSENQTDPSEWAVIDTFTTLEYVACPSVSDLFTTNLVVNEDVAFIDGNWPSMLGTGSDHFMLEFKLLSDTEWTVLSNMDSTVTSKTMGNLEHNSFYEWKVMNYCSQNQSYYSSWSPCDTFEVGSFVPQPFDPDFQINLENLICEGLSDLSFSVEQSANQPDISSSGIFSNSGSFEIFSLQEDQIIGQSQIMIGNGFIQNEYDLVVSDVINDNKATIGMYNTESNFIDTYFDIENNSEGIKIIINTINDNNSYTSGNSLEIDFFEIFRNPEPSILEFYVDIPSELNESYSNQFDFLIECSSIHSYATALDFYPNPTDSKIHLSLDGQKEISIYNLNGQRIKEFNSNKNWIDLDGIQPGLYFIEVENDSKLYVNKLILR
jgi:hypothetical protein